MKKIILALIFLISCSAFAAKWEVIEIKNEFKEPTGKIRIMKNEITNSKGAVFFDKDKNVYSIGFLSLEYIGGKGKYDESVLKIKIDGNDPVIMTGSVWTNGKMVSGTLNSKLLELMKNGKIMKVVIQKYNSETIYLEFDLEGFSEYFAKVK